MSWSKFPVLLPPLLILVLGLGLMLAETRASNADQNYNRQQPQIETLGGEGDQKGLARHFRSIWDLVSYFVKGILRARTALQARDVGVAVGRTFGIRRIQFMMMPMIYKMGVMMTMLAVLTVISLKGLMIGVILLILKLSTIMAKFYSAGQPHVASYPPPPQPLHLYLHGASGHPHYESPVYPAWEYPPMDHHYYYKG